MGSRWMLRADGESLGGLWWSRVAGEPPGAARPPGASGLGGSAGYRTLAGSPWMTAGSRVSSGSRGRLRFGGGRKMAAGGRALMSSRWKAARCRARVGSRWRSRADGSALLRRGVLWRADVAVGFCAAACAVGRWRACRGGGEQLWSALLRGGDQRRVAVVENSCGARSRIEVSGGALTVSASSSGARSCDVALSNV